MSKKNIKTKYLTMLNDEAIMRKLAEIALDAMKDFEYQWEKREFICTRKNYMKK